MKTLRAAAQQALDALHLWLWTKQIIGLEAAHDALRDALVDDALRNAQVEPVAWMHTNAIGHRYFRKKPHDAVFNPQAVYVHPERQPLTDHELTHIYTAWDKTPGLSMADFARAIERAHGIGSEE